MPFTNIMRKEQMMRFTNNGAEPEVVIYEKDYAEYKRNVDESVTYPAFDIDELESQMEALKDFFPESETELLYVDPLEVKHFNRVFYGMKRLAIQEGGYIKAVMDFSKHDAYIVTKIDFIEFCDVRGYKLLSELNSDSTLTTISALENGWIEIYINIPVFKSILISHPPTDMPDT